MRTIYGVGTAGEPGGVVAFDESTTTVNVTRPDVPVDVSPSHSGFRSDIEGLRALSVLLVALAHAGVPFLTGGFVGVDVFFVISGFLITGLLVRESDTTGKLSIRNFYARRARRILPMAALVLVSVCVASLFLMPQVDRHGVGTDVTGAALFVSNWVFAIQANDYFVADITSSPVLHFWSLSVEEQFYLIWPVLILVLASVAKRRGLGASAKRLLIGVGLAVPVTASLAWSLLGGSQGILDYYGLQTRLWELGVGGLAAVVMVGRSQGWLEGRGPIPLWVRSAVAYAGIALIMYGAFTFTSQTPFPGANALYPVVGALLVICAGGYHRVGAGVLSARPMQYVGARSYNWYLWHWPFLVFAGIIVTGGVVTEARAGVGVAQTAWAAAMALALSFLVTVVTFNLVETPARNMAFFKARPGWALAVAGALIAITVGAAQLIAGPAPEPIGNSTVSLPADGVTAIVPGYDNLVWPPVRAIDQVTRKDSMYFPDEKCYGRSKNVVVLGPNCIYGDPNGSKRIALIGDSHANMFLPAFDALGKAHGIQVSYWAHAGYSPIPIVGTTGGPTTAEWRDGLIERLNKGEPFSTVFVIRSSGHALSAGPNGVAAYESGANEFLYRIKESTSKFVFLRDTYSADFWIPPCLKAKGGDSSKCAFERESRIDNDIAAAELAGANASYPGKIFQADLAPLACPTAMPKCPVVAPDGRTMFVDKTHLTIRVSRNLAPGLYRLLKPYL